MSIIDTVTGIRWKIAAGAGVAILVIASFFLFQAQMENRHLTKLNAQLDARINNPTTGLNAQLAQARTNSLQLESALATQNQRLREQATESNARLTALTARLTEIQRQNRQLAADRARIMATPPRGTTLDERVRDIDTRVLETLR